jgi:(2R)-sulfolactate sulfo-lyase subunit alpha
MGVYLKNQSYIRHKTKDIFYKLFLRHDMPHMPGRQPIQKPFEEHEMSETHFLIHDKDDSVGVAVVENIKAGMDVVGYKMDTDEQVNLKALSDIPLGHKIALRDLVEGDTIIKYDVDMGRVVAPIKAGEHVHVHNVKTKRW